MCELPFKRGLENIKGGSPPCRVFLGTGPPCCIKRASAEQLLRANQ